MSKMVPVTDENFESEVLNSDTPVVVDFWAEWCGPCKQLMPVMEELSEELSDVKMVKVNIDESPETPTKFGVRGIPTLMVFQGGEVKDVKVGAMTKSQAQEWIESQK